MSYSTLFARAVALLLVFGLFACSSGGNGAPVASATPPSTLGNLSAEVAYFNSDGHGEVLVTFDTSIMDVGLAIVDPVTGQRRVFLNPQILASLPTVVQQFWRGHELGHHYLRCSGQASRYNEYQADAFGARVMEAQQPGAAQAIASWFRSAGIAGTPTHASGPERASYIEDVASAMAIDPTVVPPPPVQPTSQPAAFLFRNPFPEAVVVVLNGQAAGILDIGQQAGLEVPPALYEVRYIGYFSGFAYFIQVYSMQPGATTVVPF
jgi:hypothetical protein